MTKQIAPLELSCEIQLARKISSNSETVGVDTFFEASRFGCRKIIFDATKVTYSTYSCTISRMSSEMMKMDGRDNAELAHPVEGYYFTGIGSVRGDGSS